MSAKVKTDLKNIANQLPSGASYSDAMYELYLRMKVTKGQQDVKKGLISSQEEVKRKFLT